MKLVEKFVCFLAILVLVLSFASIVHAETDDLTGSTASGEAGGSSTETTAGTMGGVASLPSIEDIDLEEVVVVNSNAPEPVASVAATSYIPECVVAPELYQKMMELEKELREKHAAGEDVSELKSEIEEINKRIRTQKSACIGTTRSGVAVMPAETMPASATAVGLKCEISSDLQKRMELALKEYKTAIEAKDLEKAKTLRTKMVSLEEAAMSERKDCMEETVPGLIKQEDKSCDVPAELYEKLENNMYKISQLKKLNTTVPEDLRNEVNDLESKIGYYKAKCNALRVTADVKESDVEGYYRQRMIEAMSNEDMDSKVRALKELRSEIDETIKNMIEQKKSLKYSEMEDVVDKIEFRAGNVRVGDSETNTTDVEMEVEMDKDTPGIKIKPTELAVLLTQEGYNVTAEDIAVNESGIYVQGILVKMLPAAVYDHNKNLEKNAERVIEMKLEKEGEKAVYKAEYNVKKKILWLIPAQARHQLVIDAENGETLQEKKPWWSGIAKTVDETAAVESVVEETAG